MRVSTAKLSSSGQTFFIIYCNDITVCRFGWVGVGKVLCSYILVVRLMSVCNECDGGDEGAAVGRSSGRCVHVNLDREPQKRTVTRREDQREYQMHRQHPPRVPRVLNVYQNTHTSRDAGTPPAQWRGSPGF